MNPSFLPDAHQVPGWTPRCRSYTDYITLVAYRSFRPFCKKSICFYDPFLFETTNVLSQPELSYTQKME